VQPSSRQQGSTKEYEQNTSRRSILYKYHDGYYLSHVCFKTHRWRKERNAFKRGCYYL